MLTCKQHELLIFITERLSLSGVSPSFDEMKAAIKLNSKSGIHRLLGGLEERGFIRRHHRRARAIEVLRLPDGAPVAGSVAETVRRTDDADRDLAEALARVTTVASGMGLSRDELIQRLQGALAGGRRG